MTFWSPESPPQGNYHFCTGRVPLLKMLSQVQGPLPGFPKDLGALSHLLGRKMHVAKSFCVCCSAVCYRNRLWDSASFVGQKWSNIILYITQPMFLSTSRQASRPKWF